MQCACVWPNLLCKEDGLISGSSPRKVHQALKPVFVVVKPCSYIVMWCTGDFHPQANIVEDISVKW